MSTLSGTAAAPAAGQAAAFEPQAAWKSDEALRLAARDHKLSLNELERILELLRRPPTLTELGIFSAMWSEHCSYKSTRLHLRTLPTEGPRILIGPGENAGVVDIGDGQALVFKIESHNHPSFIEPFQGAATGVGGILRDIFTMGARPLALLNSLRFGSLEEAHTRYLLEGVVAGIAAYGNCIGVPTVGGELAFDPSYRGNPLVNVFCLGIAPLRRIFRGKAVGVGNLVVYVGSKTGRDGIHGARMASGTFDERAAELRPTVQVGDPFTEKLLLEACLEAMERGLLLGIQDMGAAGLTCSSLEMADRGGCGIELELSQVPQREEGMTPYELMLSESQERMLLVVEPGKLAAVREVFARWDLEAVAIGRVTEGETLRLTQHGQLVGELPVKALASEAPLYDRPARRPPWQDEVQAFDPSSLSEPTDYGAALSALLAAPDLCSKRWVYRQYDHMVRANTITLPGADAAVMRLPGSGRAYAISVDGNGRACFLDPYRGAAGAVAEAARNVVCAGARPVAITNCLNFGNPERPEIMWQLREAIRGIGDACRVLETPVTGGNVSLYNETEGMAIHPTPVIGMVGLLDNAARHCTPWFKAAGDRILLVGPDATTLAASTYLATLHGRVAGRPAEVDLRAEARLHELVLEALAQGWVRSAHDCADGGLAVALAECCFETGLGAEVEIPAAAAVDQSEQGAAARRRELRADVLLFGEVGGRVIVTVAEAHAEQVAQRAAEKGVVCRSLGVVGGEALRLHVGPRRDLIHEPVARLRSAWEGTLPRAFAHTAAR